MEQEFYSIELAKKGDNPNFISALKIYNEVTPLEIKTNPEEITYWIDNINEKFKLYVFNLYWDNKIIGLGMLTYIPSVKTIIIEYISVEEDYRKNIVYLSYINLFGQYFKKNSLTIDYWLTDINNKNNGQNSDYESQILSVLLDIEGYKKIDAPFLTPELGITTIKGVEAYFMIKSFDNIYDISKDSYIAFIDSIYFDYYLEWYTPLLTTKELSIYKRRLNFTYSELQQIINHLNDPIKVLTNDSILEQSSGHTPIKENKSKNQFILKMGIIAISLISSVIISYFIMWLSEELGYKITDGGSFISGILALIMYQIADTIKK